MPITSLAQRISASRKNRSPVQNTVERHFDEIRDAIAAGASYRDIYAQMTREGHNVGKAHGSLFAAFKIVAARRAQALPTSPQELPVRPNPNVEASSPSPTVASEPPAAIVDTRRKTTNWE